MDMSGRLGTMLVSAGLITEGQLREALAAQKAEFGRLGTIVVRMGFVSEDKMMAVLSKQYNVPYVDLNKFQINPDQNLMKYVPAHVAQKHKIIPIKRIGATITIAMADPSDISAVDDIKFMTSYNVEVVLAAEGAIGEAIKKNYGVEEPPIEIDTGDGKDLKILLLNAVKELKQVEGQDLDTLSSEVEAPIVKLVNGILLQAATMGVSDIHIEPYEKDFRVRYRQDGVLMMVMDLPLQIKNAVISRLKIMSSLDIAERRLPQDGRIKLKMEKNAVMDFRVSVLPCLFGEKIVLRLLDKSNLQLDMTKLGFDEDQLNHFKEALGRPFGMVLVTGPTGSGKTTTLYSALSELNTITANVMTAEDPVEFNMKGINQVQMKDEIGLNFAAALRSFLRQDPDIIMVGETRDYETAEIGVKAALTGHLVLTTLHTNDAPSTIDRMLNMGVKTFLVSSAVILIVAQRLVRRICKDCRKPVKIPTAALIDAGFSPEEAPSVVTHMGVGCDACNKTGYKGRVALYEVMPIRDEIKKLILKEATVFDIKKAAIAGGMKTLRRSGLLKVKAGMTTLEEVVENTFPDNQAG